MRIAVIDGQGGGIGKAVVEKLRDAFKDKIKIVALGANALATSAMLKAGADEGASGENAVVVSAAQVDVIIGAIGIIATDSMLGEITAKMAEAVSKSEAVKILIPINKCGLKIAGLTNKPMLQYIEDAIELVRELL